MATRLPWLASATAWKRRGWQDIVIPTTDPPPPSGTSGGPTVTAENTGVMGASLTTTAWSAYQNSTGQVIEYKDFTHDSTWAQLYGTNNIFRYCRWANRDFAVLAAGNRFEHCESGKITAGAGSDGTEIYDHKAIQAAGMDAFGVTDDPEDILFERIYAVLTQAPGAGEHYDSIQVRGVNGFTLRDFVFDHGSGGRVGTPYNAAIFLENANGGNYNVLIEKGRIRSRAEFSLYLFAQGLVIDNLMSDNGAPDLTVPDLYGASWRNFTATNVRRPDGTPVTLA